ncbi:hypothetical protein [Mesoterricola silvestris]|uniref:hypothetical protein n=1 Tax=Mesoterricola silvestris TaxID=2927979 RepID=UPI00292F1567|nr:hypothetical protein [Mesoterricola silvestris]
MEFLFPVIMIPALAVLILGFLSFDQVIRLEYESARKDWEADGKPSGFIWRAPECTAIRSRLAVNRLSFRLLFKTPTWAETVPEALKYLRRLRLCILAWNTTILLLFILMICMGPNR